MQSFFELLKNIYNWIKDPNNQKWILIILLILAIAFGLNQCNIKNEIENQMEQNTYALKDSIHSMHNKLNDIFYTKAITVSRISELEELNKDLYDELKKMKGTVAEISKIGVKLVYIDKPIYSILEKTPNGSYAITWKDSIQYGNEFYRSLTGMSLFKLDSSNGNISPKNISTTIIKDSTYIKLITGLWKNNESDKWEIFIKNKNPNIQFELEGHVVQDEINKITNSIDKCRWHIGLNIGIGMAGPFSNKFAEDIILGYNIGLSLQYSIVDLNFWPFN